MHTACIHLSEMKRKPSYEVMEFMANNPEIETVRAAIRDCRSAVWEMIHAVKSYALLVPKKILQTRYYQSMTRNTRLEVSPTHYDEMIWVVKPE